MLPNENSFQDAKPPLPYWMTPDGFREAVQKDPKLSAFMAAWFEDQAKRLLSGDEHAVQSGLSAPAPAPAEGKEPGFAAGGLVGYDSKMDPNDRPAYEAWAAEQGRRPADEEQDYDLRGAFMADLHPDGREHLGDEFKKPWHPTFSTQSNLHGTDGHEGGEWDTIDLQGEMSPLGTDTREVNRFTPGPANHRYASPDFRRDYFREREPGVILNEPRMADGGLVDAEMPLRREPYEGEDQFFRSNHSVGGMRTEDGRVILNPHSGLSQRERSAVYENEAARLAMQDGDMPPDMNPDQRDFLQTINRGSPYGPEREMRETTIARQLSGDPSGGIATPEQRMYGASIRDKMRSPGFADGGFINAPETHVEQEGGQLEPVPHGSLPEEVADDVDAKLSVGEVVIPADVVRWHGLKTFEAMRSEAKAGLAGMHGEGRIQAAGGLTEPPETEPEDPEPDEGPAFARGGLVAPLRFAQGGFVGATPTVAPQPATAAQGFITAPNTDQFGRGTFTPNTPMPNPLNYQQGAASTTPNIIMPGVGNSTPAAPDPGLAQNAAATTTATTPDPRTGALAAGAAAAGAGLVAATTGQGGGSGGGILDTLGPKAFGWGVKEAGNYLLGSPSAGAAGASSFNVTAPLTQTAGDTALMNSLQGIGDGTFGGFTGSITGAPTYGSAGLTDALQASGDFASQGVTIAGQSTFDSMATTVGNWASSAGTALASAGAGAVGSYIGAKIGDALNGDLIPDPYVSAGTTAAGAIAGAYVGTMVLPGIGTAIGAGLGALLGALGGSFIGNDPDYPYSWTGSTAINVDQEKASFSILQNGGAMNKGNPDASNRLGAALSTYINARAQAEGLEANGAKYNVQGFGAGYSRGQYYFNPGGDIAAHNSENPLWRGKDAATLGDLAYTTLRDQGFFVRPGEGMSRDQVIQELRDSMGDPDGDGFATQYNSWDSHDEYTPGGLTKSQVTYDLGQGHVMSPAEKAQRDQDNAYYEAYIAAHTPTTEYRGGYDAPQESNG